MSVKKFYILILLCVCSFLTKAQHTITAANNPTVGDIESYRDLDSTGLFFGSAGTSQTWNYSAMTAVPNPASSFTYVPMSSVPNNFLFPGGTIANDDGAGNFGVLSNNSTKFEYLGYATATATNCWSYTDPLKMYDIPFSYGNTSTDVFKIILPTFTATGTFTTYADGTGTLQLPIGTYTNVLKLNYVVYEIDTTLTSIQNFTLLINQYYSAISKFPLLEVQTINQTITTGTNVTTTYAKYGRIIAFGVPSGIITIENDKSFVIYPNPVSNGEVYISNTNSFSGRMSVEIINVLGQIVKTILLENQNATNAKKIDMSDLTSGIYYLRITGKEGAKTQKIIID